MVIDPGTFVIAMPEPAVRAEVVTADVPFPISSSFAGSVEFPVPPFGTLRVPATSAVPRSTDVLVEPVPTN